MTDLDALLAPVWDRSDRLFGMLTPEALRTRALPLRHPPIFYLGHLPAFAWNHLGRGVLGEDPVDATFEELFERGIDPLDDAAAEDATIEGWPPVSDILAYRDRVRERVREVVPTLADRAADDPLAEGDRVLHLIAEHELMHHETLLYILQRMAPARLRPDPVVRPLQTGGDVRPPRRVPVKGGPARLGTRLDQVPFAWDNELGPNEVAVETFLLDDLPVTVGRYRAFIEDGGYQTAGLWDDASWAWRIDEGLEHPRSWRRAGDGFEVRSLFAWHPAEQVGGWPVLVSHAEALAYARWKGGRLPTEAELQRAAYADDGRPFPWGDAAPTLRRANLGFRSGGLRPVGRSPDGRGPFGHHDLVGNAWQWTDTAFGPLPGFDAWIRTYPGYSQDFFDGAHRVVFGASWATDDRLARPSFRNWYQRHYPYVFATFRLAWD